MRAINNPTITPCNDLRTNIAVIFCICMVPSTTKEKMQSIRVKFLHIKIHYLLLAKGIKKIENKDPNIAPIVRHPISNPLVRGFCIALP